MMILGGVLLGMAAAFWALARFEARPGFNALALAACLASMPLLLRLLPGQGFWHEAGAVGLVMIAATVGTGLGGGLRPRPDDHHSHSHDHAH